MLLAADAGFAVTVAHQQQRRMPVGLLQWRQRAKRAAPAAAPLEQHAAGEGQDQGQQQYGTDNGGAVIENRVTQQDECEKRDDRKVQRRSPAASRQRVRAAEIELPR